MDIRNMRQVLEICRHGSFGRAAAALGISQPTLSRSIARLEDRLQVTLFERTATGARPNQLAEHIAGRASALLQTASSLSSEVRAMASGEAGKLRVGLGPATRELLHSGLLGAIVTQFPNLQLEIHQDSVDALVRKVANNEYEFVLVAADGLNADQSLVRVDLFADRMVFVVRPSHPLASAQDVGVDALFAYPLALPGPISSMEHVFMRGLTPERTPQAGAYVAQDYRLLIDIVRNSDAITGGPAFVFADHVRAGTLRQLQTRVRLDYICSFVTTTHAWHVPVVRKLSQIIADRLGAMPQPGKPRSRRRPPAHGTAG